jgi:hypothetical protein
MSQHWLGLRYEIKAVALPREKNLSNPLDRRIGMIVVGKRKMVHLESINFTY